MVYQPSEKFKSLLRDIYEEKTEGEIPQWINELNDENFSNRLSYWETFIPGLMQHALTASVFENGRFSIKRIRPAYDFEPQNLEILKEFDIASGDFFVEIETYGFGHIVYLFEKSTVIRISNYTYIGELFLVPVEGMLPKLCITGRRPSTAKKHWMMFVKGQFNYRLRTDNFDNSFLWGMCEVKIVQNLYFLNMTRGLHDRVVEPLKIGDYLLQKGIYDDDLFQEAELFVMHLANFIYLSEQRLFEPATFQAYIQALEKNPHMIPLAEGEIYEQSQQPEEFEVSEVFEDVVEDFTSEQSIQFVPQPIMSSSLDEIVHQIQTMTLTTSNSTQTSSSPITLSDLEALNSTNI